MEYDPGTAEALRLIEDVAQHAIQDGRARIIVEHSDGVGGWLISLTPANPRACAVSLTADHPPQIDMWLGPEPTTASYEFWGADWPENLARLRERLEAVLAGGYEQTVETRKRNSIEITGRFDLPGGVETFREATRATGAVEPGETYVLRFEPY